MIFNSDYLDTNGNSAAGGRNSGKAPAIHSGVLTSPTIDATAFPSAALSFINTTEIFNQKHMLRFLQTMGFHGLQEFN